MNYVSGCQTGFTNVFLNIHILYRYKCLCIYIYIFGSVRRTSIIVGQFVCDRIKQFLNV